MRRQRIERLYTQYSGNAAMAASDPASWRATVAAYQLFEPKPGLVSASIRSNPRGPFRTSVSSGRPSTGYVGRPAVFDDQTAWSDQRTSSASPNSCNSAHTFR